MDTKNVIAAISLSAAVIIIYSLFFAPDPQQIKQKQLEQEKIQNLEKSEAPSLDQEKKNSKISRGEAIKKSKRVEFENENIKGSISLIGSSIDDLTYKKYTITKDGKDNVILLNPKNAENGYYIDTGWATNNENIDLPNSKTIWEVEEKTKLTPNNPINLKCFNP